MDALPLLRRMAANEAWSNHRLHAAIAGIDPVAYRLDTRTSFFPSIHLTLSHILYVGLFYVDALTEGGRGASLWPESERCDREGTFEQIRAAQAELDQELIRWLGGDVSLTREVGIERPDRIQREAAGDVLLHLFQHAIHHRGQVHAMLSGTGAKPPQLDEFFLREELPLRRAELIALGLPLV